MKVLINAASAKMGGNANYITHLLRSFASLPEPAQVVVCLPAETNARLGNLPDKIRRIPVRISNAGWLARLWWEQVTLRKFLRAEKADALFSSGNFGMLNCPVPQILLVRNAIYFSPIYFSRIATRLSALQRIAFRLRRRLIIRSVGSAQRVMTPTKAMLDDLRRFVEVNSEKEFVNPYGTEPVEAVNVPFETISRPIRLLFVSVYYDHKNLSTLLKALVILNKGPERSFSLKTTALPDRELAAVLKTFTEDQALAARPEISRWVEFKGLLPVEETRQLYAEADVFVFPSLTESFGQPLAEAMAHGLPVVASDTPVNREVCADAAVYFQTLDPANLAAKVQEVTNDENLRRRLSEAGRSRAALLFRWDEHSRRLADAFATLLSAKRQSG